MGKSERGRQVTKKSERKANDEEEQEIYMQLMEKSKRQTCKRWGRARDRQANDGEERERQTGD